MAEHETHKWAAMDSASLRGELHHVATERNRAAAAVGAIARNCSGELEALYFKFKKKKHARDELQEVDLDGSCPPRRPPRGEPSSIGSNGIL